MHLGDGECDREFVQALAEAKAQGCKGRHWIITDASWKQLESFALSEEKVRLAEAKKCQN